MDKHKPIAAFRAADGQEILYLTELPGHGQVLYSPDGKRYYALAVLEFTGTRLVHDLTFEGHIEGTWRRHYAEVLLDGVTYKQVPPPTTVAPVPLPRVRAPERLIRRADGDFVLLSVEKYDPRDATRRLYVGPGEPMREIQVLSVTHPIDGGAASVATEEETLCCDAEPTWGGEEAVSLDPEDFNIVESGTGVTIVPRLAVADAMQMLSRLHKRPWDTDKVVWSTKPDDRDYVAIGVAGDEPFVQIWLPDQPSVTFRGDDAIALLALDERDLGSREQA